MGKRKKADVEVDVKKFRDAATEFQKSIGDQARHFAEDAEAWASPQVKKAQKWAEPKVKGAQAWAGPKVDKAQKWAGPKVEEARKNVVKAAAPRIEAAAASGVDLVDKTSHKLTDDVLPRIQKSMHDAAAAVGAVEVPTGRCAARKARKNARQAEKKLSKELQKASGEPRRGRRILGWTLVGSAAAGAGYLLWRRSQPVEDPWAEEYWQKDIEAPVQAAEDVAEDVKEAAEGAVEEAADKVEDAVEAVEDKAEDVQKN
ncbi:MAG TPA: hypothetical protein VFC82_11285 [Actinomycetaceae bacterium]|nr:hypothetical protein [Actinomycetaceae bacterium]